MQGQKGQYNATIHHHGIHGILVARQYCSSPHLGFHCLSCWLAMVCLVHKQLQSCFLFFIVPVAADQIASNELSFEWRLYCQISAVVKNEFCLFCCNLSYYDRFPRSHGFHFCGRSWTILYVFWVAFSADSVFEDFNLLISDDFTVVLLGASAKAAFQSASANSSVRLNTWFHFSAVSLQDTSSAWPQLCVCVCACLPLKWKWCLLVRSITTGPFQLLPFSRT